MKIKRYVDRDMRHVLRRVRSDQGPEAVILSNRRVGDGIEVIAAVDYDESLIQRALGDRSTGFKPTEDAQGDAADSHCIEGDNAGEMTATIPAPLVAAETRAVENGGNGEGPSAQPLTDMREELSSLRELVEAQLGGLLWNDGARRAPLRAQMLRNLARLGIAPDVADIVIGRLEPTEDVADVWRSPLAELAQIVPIKRDGLLTDGGTVALIGPTGVGKTTTIAKIAAQFSMRHGSDEIALICADAYRIGAREHLTAFGNIIGVKVHGASTPEELKSLLERLSSRKLVLIDTEGMSQRDLDLSNRLAAYGSNDERVKFYLTLSAACQEAVLDETIRGFNEVPLEGAIVTKIDEAAQIGCVLSTLIRHDLAAAWFSNGQRIPDDLHAAANKRLWLMHQATECLDLAQPKVDERVMAERYGHASVAHA